jgi:hypothetical protein
MPNNYSSKDTLGLARIGRLYRLMKLARLIKAMKMIYKSNDLVRAVIKYLKIGPGLRRLLLLTIILVLLQHLAACLW